MSEVIYLPRSLKYSPGEELSQEVMAWATLQQTKMLENSSRAERVLDLILSEMRNRLPRMVKDRLCYWRKYFFLQGEKALFEDFFFKMLDLSIEVKEKWGQWKRSMGYRGRTITRRVLESEEILTWDFRDTEERVLGMIPNGRMRSWVTKRYTGMRAHHLIYQVEGKVRGIDLEEVMKGMVKA